MKIRNVTNRPRVIAATQQVVDPGGEVEVPDDLAASLVEQTDRWAKGEPKTTSKKEG